MKSRSEGETQAIMRVRLQVTYIVLITNPTVIDVLPITILLQLGIVVKN